MRHDRQTAANRRKKGRVSVRLFSGRILVSRRSTWLDGGPGGGTVTAVAARNGLHAARPAPALAWEVFKRFAARAVDVPTSELWFEAADGNPDPGTPAYFDFVRMFMHYPEGGAEWGEQITARFTAVPSVRLGLWEVSIQAEDVADLPAWFEAVEASPSFKAGRAFAGWSFGIRIDGC